MVTTLYKVADVARILNVSASCVYALIEKGVLACHRIGLGRGTVRISETDLNHYLATSRKHKDESVQSQVRPRPQVKLKLKHLQI